MNLAPNVAQFFSAAALFRLLQDAIGVKNNVPTPLPDFFYNRTPGTPPPLGTQVAFYRQTGNRAAAKATPPGAPANNIGTMPNSDLITVTGLQSRESWDVPYDLIVGLHTGLPWFVDRATIELQRIAAIAANRQQWFKNDQIHSALANGKIWTDVTGTVLSSASGATNTIDYGFATTNKLTKDGAASTQSIGDWSNAATDIGFNIRTLKKTAIKASGYEPTTIFYGTSIPQFLATNTTIKAYGFNPLLSEAIASRNEVPNGTLGMNWVPVYTAVSGAGTFWFPDNFVGFAPTPSVDWYEMSELGQLVPAAGVATQLITSDPSPTTGNMATVKYGAFSYAYHKVDPYQMVVINGYGCLPVLKAPKAYFFGTCS